MTWSRNFRRLAGSSTSSGVGESLWLEPYAVAPDAGYEERESVELAFVAARGSWVCPTG